ncbi:hypothetical protein HGRIS_010614 [Hohenbuehelia grisea]|uniref:Protein LCHN n=1 Tax=Hohenbuehelia grisea TaxID=104357 RepID=A0ABR3IXL4_9AGAR
MSLQDSKAKYPQDVVAVFHAAFHPTKGNIIDWSLKASDDLSLDHLEYSALPSGLHLVDEDVVYFNKDGHHGVCVFRRRKTTEHGHRGFRLSSLGILLAKSRRPRPWRHTAALKELITQIYSKLEMYEILEPTDEDWEPARAFFEERKVRRADLGGAGDWNGWSHDLYELDNPHNPDLHLTHLLRILGPSSLTLYKHIIGRRRILILTLPPVEAACILCHVAADLCFEEQVDYTSSQPGSSRDDKPARLRGKHREGINVLGMVTLSDLDRLIMESKTGRGWIACTTDAIFLDKPQCYDLLINLTTLSPNKSTRPTFSISRPIETGSSRGPTHRLSTSRFTWSDVKLWNEIDRLLQIDAGNNGTESHTCCGPSGTASLDGKSRLITTWTDAWRVYEDVCLICAGLWMGSWRSNSQMSYSTAGGARSWGAVRLEGDDDLSLGSFVRTVGAGIEGGPGIGGTSASGNGSSLTPTTPTNKPMRRVSAMSWPGSRAANASSSTAVSDSDTDAGDKGKSRELSSSSALSAATAQTDDTAVTGATACEPRDGQLLTTLALLQTFHAHTCFQLSQLESFLSPERDATTTVVLSSRDLMAFELGPWSALDERYIGWLADEYAGGAKVVVKRGWKDVLGVMFGYS